MVSKNNYLKSPVSIFKTRKNGQTVLIFSKREVARAAKIGVCDGSLDLHKLTLSIFHY